MPYDGGLLVEIDQNYLLVIDWKDRLVLVEEFSQCPHIIVSASYLPAYEGVQERTQNDIQESDWDDHTHSPTGFTLGRIGHVGE